MKNSYDHTQIRGSHALNYRDMLFTSIQCTCYFLNQNLTYTYIHIWVRTL